jgi:hypothetical protein
MKKSWKRIRPLSRTSRLNSRRLIKKEKPKKRKLLRSKRKKRTLKDSGKLRFLKRMLFKRKRLLNKRCKLTELSKRLWLKLKSIFKGKDSPLRSKSLLKRKSKRKSTKT